ncbi:secreted frizzled-related protein 5-like isoform X2 [Penaeus chinensis]|uniref:secreted frizzled-related protein 5-like isoform X2 n=1 Tax=Penaeus chinensis TaxID=139456 RepID=UPI001FB687A3|nr:secreted frizzled-related protein 5-like isoform X2 [Penaeus chinensis]
MLGGSALLPLPFLLLVLGAAAGTEAYFADWGMIGGRPQEPTCVDIPESMPLCSGIDYNKMRLPNLLEHDTLKEAQQQAGYWVPLLNLRCHADTQLFLCSLFTPVCLESPIYPCRSLCEAVRNGCESRMRTYSFPWPDMLRCDKFPLDNDMCITVQHTKSQRPDGDCEVCQPVETYENILDNFCRAAVVVKTRVKKQRKNKVICKKARVYKSEDTEEARVALRRPRFSLTGAAGCCQIQASRTAYLIMAQRKDDELVPTFVMPFRKSKPLRMALKKFRSLDCSDPKLIDGGFDIPTLSQEPPQRPSHPKRPKTGRKKPKGRRGRKRGRTPRPQPSSPPEGVDGAMGPAFPSPASYPTLAMATPPPPSPPPSPVLESDQSLRFLQENELEGHTPPSIDPPTQNNDAEEQDDADGEEAGDADAEGPGGKRRGRKRGRRQRNKATRRDRRKKDRSGEEAEATAEP